MAYECSMFAKCECDAICSQINKYNFIYVFNGLFSATDFYLILLDMGWECNEEMSSAARLFISPNRNHLLSFDRVEVRINWIYGNMERLNGCMYARTCCKNPWITFQMNKHFNWIWFLFIVCFFPFFRLWKISGKCTIEFGVRFGVRHRNIRIHWEPTSAIEFARLFNG